MKQNRNLPQKKFKNLLFFVVAVLISACSSNPKSNATEITNEFLSEEKNLVDVILLERQYFTYEIINKGKLSAIQKAELYFKNPGIIESIRFRKGKLSEKGADSSGLYGCRIHSVGNE